MTSYNNGTKCSLAAMSCISFEWIACILDVLMSIDNLNDWNIIVFQKALVLRWNSLGSEQRVAAKITDFCRYIASTPLAAVCVPTQRRGS